METLRLLGKSSFFSIQIQIDIQKKEIRNKINEFSHKSQTAVWVGRELVKSWNVELFWFWLLLWKAAAAWAAASVANS